MAGNEAYRIEYCDSRGRWHLRRGGFDTASAAVDTARGNNGAGWRILDATGAIVATDSNDAPCDCGATRGGWYFNHAAGADGCEDAPMAPVCAEGCHPADCSHSDRETLQAVDTCACGAPLRDAPAAQCWDCYNDAPAAPIEASSDADNQAATIAALTGDATVTASEASAVLEWCQGWALDCDWIEDAATIAAMPALAFLAACNRALDGGLAVALADVRRLDAIEDAKPREDAATIAEGTRVQVVGYRSRVGGAESAPFYARMVRRLPSGTILVDCENANDGAGNPVRLYVSNRGAVVTVASRQDAAIEAPSATVAIEDANLELAAGAYSVSYEDAHGRPYGATIEAIDATTVGMIDARGRLAAWRESGTGAATNPLRLLGIERTASYGAGYVAPTAALGTYTAIYRAAGMPSIYEQSVAAPTFAAAVALANREATNRGLVLVALAVGAPDGFGAAILAAQVAEDAKL